MNGVIQKLLLTFVIMFMVDLATADTLPWEDPSLSPTERAEALMDEWSFDQKIAFLVNDDGSPAPEYNVPEIIWSDGPAGLRGFDNVTVYPAPQVLAATFDRRLAYAYGKAIGEEAAGKGVNNLWGPAFDITRTWRFGRAAESHSEDPYLSGQIGMKEVMGIQDQNVLCLIKHFAANNQEYQRLGIPPGLNISNSVVSDKALQEMYFRPFRYAVKKAEAGAVMGSYNEINGIQACQNPYSLGTLKDSFDFSWGFDGFVWPDYGAVVDYPAAVKAGLDDLGQHPFGGPVIDWYSQIYADPELQDRVEDMVRRRLVPIFRLGMWENRVIETGDPDADVSTQAHKDLATKIAQQGTVLLKNRFFSLPIHKWTTKSIAVMGNAADGCEISVGGSAYVTPVAGSVITPLDGITTRAAQDNINVSYTQGALGDVPLQTMADVFVDGLTAEYFTTPDLSGAPYATQPEQSIDWAYEPPVGPIPAWLWSARWTGTFIPDETGTYDFSLKVSGAARLYIDDQLITEGTTQATVFIGGHTLNYHGEADLVAGQPVEIRVEYESAANIFGPGLSLGYQSPQSIDTMINEAVMAAEEADMAVIFASHVTSEGADRFSLKLPGSQDRLIQAVAEANRRTVVVLNTAGPVLMPWLDRVAAVLVAGYPGQQTGEAIAGVLFGDAEPGGRLTVTYPASENQGVDTTPETYPGVDGSVYYDEGVFVGYRWYDQYEEEPLFPFGYGLSYTRFKYGKRLRITSRDNGHKVKIRLRVWNIGPRPGSEVVQLYLGFPEAAEEPPKQLKGFKKVRIKPFRGKWTKFVLDDEDLAVFDETQNDWVVHEGVYKVYVGSSARDLHAMGQFVVSN